MGHRECFEFGERHLSAAVVKGRDVLEVGAHIDGGSLRPYVSLHGPRSYVGIDIQAGPGVDVVCDAMDLLQRFGAESFDVLIANELLEHVRDWRKIIHVFKNVLRPGGIAILTTRSYGFPFHHAPFDFWRYEPADMEAIFRDFEIVAIERDPHVGRNGQPFPGVFVAVRRPANFQEGDLRSYELYSILTGGRQRSVSNWTILGYELFRLGPRYLLNHYGLPFVVREYLSRKIFRPRRLAAKRRRAAAQA